MTEAEKEIYEYSNNILQAGESEFVCNYPYKNTHTERCIEVPWFAAKLNKYKVQSLLDVGFTFASHDYLRLLLNWKKEHELEGTDIIDPQRVRQRYPLEWWEEIESTTVYLNDITEKSIKKECSDAVSLISTMEHIGFDKPSVTMLQSAFERCETVENVIQIRDLETENKVLKNVASMLKNNGYVFISVPAGHGGPILIKDSMGLYGCYWEYEEDSWRKIVEHNEFVCLEQRFFIEKEQRWKEVNSIIDLEGVTAINKNYAAGLAVAVLKKK